MAMLRSMVEPIIWPLRETVSVKIARVTALTVTAVTLPLVRLFPAWVLTIWFVQVIPRLTIELLITIALPALPPTLVVVLWKAVLRGTFLGWPL